MTYRKVFSGILLATVVISSAGCSSKAKAPVQPSETTSSTADPSASTPGSDTGSDTTSSPGQPSAISGAGCQALEASLPTSGEGSLSSFASEPVSTVLSQIPSLSTFSSMTDGKYNANINYSSALDTGGPFTIFAPVDDAFGTVDPALAEGWRSDASILENTVTYHVLPRRPDAAALLGEQYTTQGTQVTVTKNDAGLKIDDATVVCGGIQTQNATLYLIDSILDAPAPEIIAD